MEQRLLLLPFEDGLEKEPRLLRLQQLVAYALVTGVRLAEPILQQLLLPLRDENGEQAVEGVRAFEAVKEVEGSPLEAVREVRQEADRLENGLK